MDGLQALGDTIILVLLAVRLRMLFTDAREGIRSSPRIRIGLRIARLVTYGVGLVIIAVSLILAVGNIRRIVTAPSARGVITYVQHSSHTFTPWSYYVNFRAGNRRRHEFAYTSSIFERKAGDSVTVIYDAKDPTKTEIIAYDADWVVGCGLIFAGGLLVWGFGAFVYGWWS